MRSFLALILPDPVVEALEKLQARLPVGRRVPAANLHLTLSFLDEQSEESLADLHGELELLGAQRFDLAIAGLGTFGSHAPKLLYAGAEPVAGLVDLHARIGGAVRRAGIVLPRERFRPHVTLARFGAGLAGGDLARLSGFVADHAGFAVPPEPVSDFALYRSVLRAKGALHEELARYPLR